MLRKTGLASGSRRLIRKILSKSTCPTSPKSRQTTQVSLYFELAAEGWRDFPWRGPVDVALQATVGDLWDPREASANPNP